MDTQEYDIFISYRHHYIHWVIPLYINLTEQGYKVFLDSHSLVQGRSIEEELHKYIDQVKHFIVIATNDITSKDSEWVPKECIYAEQHNKSIKIHPLIFDQKKPDLPFEQEYQYINFNIHNETSYRYNIFKLFSALEGKKALAHEAFKGWLDIPENSIYDNKKIKPSALIKNIEAKNRLAKCFYLFRSVESIDHFDNKTAHNLYIELSELVNNKDPTVHRQSLQLICLLHTGHAEFYQEYPQPHGIPIKKISALLHMAKITDADKERVRNIKCTDIVKATCEAGT